MSLSNKPVALRGSFTGCLYIPQLSKSGKVLVPAAPVQTEERSRQVSTEHSEEHDTRD